MRKSLIAVLAASLLGLAACGSDNSATKNSDGLVTVDVTMSESFALPWLIGQQQGFFEDHGVKVENLEFASGGSTTVRQQLSGGSPIGDISYAAALDAVEQGADLLIVSSSIQAPDGVDFCALAGNDQVNTLEDVKKLGVTNPNSVSTGVARLFLAQEGRDDDVEVVFTGGVGEGIALLEGGELDVTFCDPQTFAARSDSLKRVVTPGNYLTKYQTSVITVAQGYAEENPEVVTGLIEGFKDSVDWLYDNPEEAATIYAEHFDLTMEHAQAIIDLNVEMQHWAPGFDTDALNNVTEALQLMTDRTEPVDFCDVFTADYLPEGMPKGPLEDC